MQATIKSLLKLLPKFDSVQKQISKLLYLSLAKGKPIGKDEICESLGYTKNQLNSVLKTIPCIEFEGDEIVAYRGVTVQNSLYEFIHNGGKFFTWCAFDSLFMYDLIPGAKRIKSTCPSCSESISITESTIGETMVKMSFVLPKEVDYESNLKSSFCCNVSFYCSDICASQSTANECKVFTLQEGLIIAQKRNEHLLELD